MTAGIVGLGLISGSMAKAYAEAGETVLAWNRSREMLDFAILSGAVSAPLTDENLCATYYGLNKKYYGDAIIHDKEISYEWARIPHFYRSFYVYKYATGIISAISIAHRVLTEGESAVKDYFSFLSGGCCTDPVSILKRAGVDLTAKAPFETAMKEFEETLEAFEKIDER